MANRQPIASVRKTPTQARARNTVDSILDAAAQILMKEGDGKLTTNHIARKAGFSIGTIYQYFPNKEEILLTLVERQQEQMRQRILATLEERRGSTLEGTVRQVVGVLIEVFNERRKAPQGLALLVIRLAVTRGAPFRLDSMTEILTDISRTYDRSGFRTLTQAEAFILTRALLGVLRQAVMEDSPLLDSPDFEDGLVRLILSFLRCPMESEEREGTEGC